MEADRPPDRRVTRNQAKKNHGRTPRRPASSPSSLTGSLQAAWYGAEYTNVAAMVPDESHVKNLASIDFGSVLRQSPNMTLPSSATVGRDQAKGDGGRLGQPAAVVSPLQPRNLAGNPTEGSCGLSFTPLQTDVSPLSLGTKASRGNDMDVGNNVADPLNDEGQDTDPLSLENLVKNPTGSLVHDLPENGVPPPSLKNIGGHRDEIQKENAGDGAECGEVTTTPLMEERPKGLNGAGDGIDNPMHQTTRVEAHPPSGLGTFTTNTMQGEHSPPRFVERTLAIDMDSDHIHQPAVSPPKQQGDPVKGSAAMQEAPGSKSAVELVVRGGAVATVSPHVLGKDQPPMISDTNMQAVPSSSLGSSSCSMVQPEVSSMACKVDGKIVTHSVEDPLGSPTVHGLTTGTMHAGLNGGANMVHGAKHADMHDPNMHEAMTMQGVLCILPYHLQFTRT